MLFPILEKKEGGKIAYLSCLKGGSGGFHNVREGGGGKKKRSSTLESMWERNGLGTTPRTAQTAEKEEKRKGKKKPSDFQRQPRRKGRRDSLRDIFVI